VTDRLVGVRSTVLACFCALALIAGIPVGTGPLAHAQSPDPSSSADPRASAQTDPDDPRSSVFRSGIELVTLSVTVTDRDKNHIVGLGPEDFVVFEDGVAQDLSFFAATRTPVDLMILLDTSASMTPILPQVHEAAVGFIRWLQSGDRGAVMEFNSVVRLVQPFTEQIDELEAAVRGTRARGATALYQALYIGLREFQQKARQEEARSQAIVLLSDGEDTSSLLRFEDVTDLAKRLGVRIYTISLISPYEADRLREQGRRRFLSLAERSLRALSLETGAQAFYPLHVRELAGVYGQIAEEIAHQYSLGYASSNRLRDGSFRNVQVRVVSRPDARPRTRSGYYAERDWRSFFESRPGGR
jgi:Ca-activated chloride channel homolog